MKSYIVIFLALLCVVSSALELDGRTVILLVSEHRQGDPQMEKVKAELLRVREELGLDTQEMPIVFMGFKDSDTDRKYFDRLGFQTFDSPVLCVVEWSKPSSYGPKRILNTAVARSVNPHHVDFIVENYLNSVQGAESLALRPQPFKKAPAGAGGDLGILSTQFEITGSPLFLTKARVRLRNASSAQAENVNVRFLYRMDQQAEWQFLGETAIDRIKPSFFASSELVVDSEKFALLDSQGKAQACSYRVEVEVNGKVQSREGNFRP